MLMRNKRRGFILLAGNPSFSGSPVTEPVIREIFALAFSNIRHSRSCYVVINRRSNHVRRDETNIRTMYHA